jgi:type II secretory pathway pseudopilin PulG
MKKKYNWFTLVELIIVITVLAILSTIWFLWFTWYTKDARNSTRTTTISSVKTSLALYKEETSKYPYPDGPISSWSINNQQLVNNGEIWDWMKIILKISWELKDPLTWTNYTYWVTSDNKEYQIWSISEWWELWWIIVENAYAAWEIAKVEWSYKWILKYSSGSRTYVSNVPSLIFNNTWSVDLMSNWVYYVINNKENLPYNIKWIKDISIQKKNSTELIKELTNTWSAVLTWVDITEIINWSKKVDEIFTWALLWSFNIRW